jgi:diaminopimelate epimerase
MKIPFWKMHGACNDFILVDDRARTFPLADRAWLAAIAHRRTGVGCEGIILIQPSDKADFRMRFINPDGSEVDMCGNGARCVARLAHELQVAGSPMTIDTLAGILRAEVHGGEVLLVMSEPRDFRLNQVLELDGRKVTYHFVNTGVPHAVIEMDALDAVDVKKMGAGVRYHAAFSPAGTNANFISVTGPSAVRVRTYERGVEDETLACGTGVVASALIAAKLGRVRNPVQVTPTGRDVLTVDFSLTPTGAQGVTLRGPAAHVFRGELDYRSGTGA